METDIGNTIDYNPTVEPLPNENDKDEDDTREYYFQPSEMNYAQPPPISRFYQRRLIFLEV